MLESGGWPARATLAPFVKGRLLEACVETAIADATVSVVDCPVPPILAR